MCYWPSLVSTDKIGIFLVSRASRFFRIFPVFINFDTVLFCINHLFIDPGLDY